ncbi:endonuclease/exonuclease/phosphatase family protein [Streptomyces sp. NBC_01387]|uniref:endonuclease/exonuclease/phosphatase family protein n=1 Tax=unclassified Streptomyces TaxID=2593676 RepID=UPI00202433AE|nr:MULTISPECIES: endonuclease/exonuclease/phosphatase family protein [unclassified Streptomyces]MCX4547613.1 endonuclease/exonuclease/phosphatase family protein [Streptomyces sp. NBC_01500]
MRPHHRITRAGRDGAVPMPRGTARLTRRWAAICSLLLLLMALPTYAQADSLPVTTPQSLHFVSYNICGSACPKSATDSATNRMNAVVAQASPQGWNTDAIFLQEVCEDQYDTFNTRLQPLGYHGKFTATIAAGGSATACKGKYAYGVALFVKGPILASTVLPLTVGNEVEKILVPCVRTTLHGRDTWACSVHLYWKDAALNQAESVKLAAQAKAWEDAGTPVVLGGDFNATPRSTSLGSFYSPSADDGGHGRFIEADETDKDSFNQQVCDPAARLYCRSGETTFTGSTVSKLDYLMFGERYFRAAQGDVLPRDATVSDHQLYRGAVSWAGMSGAASVGDLTGDSAGDIVAIARASGTLYRYAGPAYSGASRVSLGGGWNVYDRIVGVGDLTGDGVSDLLAVDGDGGLFRYSGPDYAADSKVQIGTGWSGMAGISAVGDLTGDDVPDIVAVARSTGALYRYTGPGFPGGSRVGIGTGWNVYNQLAGVGDLTGDSVSDLLAVDANGDLFRLSGPDYADSSKARTGTGWNSMSNITGVGDLTGDGAPDIIATKAATGELYRYSGPGFAGGARVLIGTGW